MTSSAIIIRTALPTDLETVVEFNRALAFESENIKLSASTLSEGVRTALSDPQRCTYFLAGVEGTIAGQTMVTTEWSDWRNGYFWWIQSVYIAPDFRRRGIYRALHEHVREKAKEHADVLGIRLYVYNKNCGAIETYKSIGMQMTDYLICEEIW